MKNYNAKEASTALKALTCHSYLSKGARRLCTRVMKTWIAYTICVRWPLLVRCVMGLCKTQMMTQSAIKDRILKATIRILKATVRILKATSMIKGPMTVDILVIKGRCAIMQIQKDQLMSDKGRIQGFWTQSNIKTTKFPIWMIMESNKAYL